MRQMSVKYWLHDWFSASHFCSSTLTRSQNPLLHFPFSKLMPIKKIKTFVVERPLQSNVVPQALLTSELLIAPSLYAEHTFV